MNDEPSTGSHRDAKARPTETDQNIVLVLQGGGALGAYQAGVYQALHESSLEPDWIIGTSIGAFNAGIIAGNAPSARVEKLSEFWSRLAYRGFSGAPDPSGLFDVASYWKSVFFGMPSFFRPNPFAFFGTHTPVGANTAGLYSTAPLQEMLDELIDFSVVNDRSVRLTVGAANVRKSEMKYFDTRDMPLDVRHLMASGALPPAFPAVSIDDELYWDGGILSNSPTEAIFNDNPRRDALVFAVHLWNPVGDAPATIWDVLNRKKDIQYSSRVSNQITQQMKLHDLRHVVNELTELLPGNLRNTPKVKELSAWGCTTVMHLVRLLAPHIDNENHTKDMDFNPFNIRLRWETGYRDTLDVIRKAPWRAPVDPFKGVVLHEYQSLPPGEASGA